MLRKRIILRSILLTSFVLFQALYSFAQIRSKNPTRFTIRFLGNFIVNNTDITLIDSLGLKMSNPKINKDINSFSIDLNNISSASRLLVSLQVPNLREPIYFDFLIEPGDSVVVNQEGEKFQFTGRGNIKYRIQNRINQNLLSLKQNLPIDSHLILRYFHQIDSIENLSLSLLKNVRTQLGEKSYAIVKIYTTLLFESEKLSVGPKQGYRKALRNYKDPYLKLENLKLMHGISGFGQTLFNIYLRKFQFDHFIQFGTIGNIKDYYQFFLKNCPEEEKENFIYSLLTLSRFRTEYSLISCIDDALTYLKNSNHKKVLQNIRDSTMNGAQAYNFSLPDTSGKIVHLSDFKGKTILLDFYYSSCGACAELHPFLENIRKKFLGKPFDLIAISIDKEKQKWLNDIEKGLRTSKNNINLYTGGKGDNDPIIKHYFIESFPTLILITKDGEVRRIVTDPRIDNGFQLSAQITELINL